MDEQRLDQNGEEQQENTGYIPRPMWQVWLARIGLVLFIFVIIMYYLNMFRGGL